MAKNLTNAHGLRGSMLEEMINMTNEAYAAKSLAIVQKIPTPITPVKIDNESRTISLAFFEQKSTVDYIGAVQGIPICFDAKETSKLMLPMQNIHDHQIEFMSRFTKQKGIAFLIVYFKKKEEFYYLPFDLLEKFWLDSKSGGRKSIPYDAFSDACLLKNKAGFLVHYLEGIDWELKNK